MGLVWDEKATVGNLRGFRTVPSFSTFVWTRKMSRKISFCGLSVDSLKPAKSRKYPKTRIRKCSSGDCTRNQALLCTFS